MAVFALILAQIKGNNLVGLVAFETRLVIADEAGNKDRGGLFCCGRVILRESNGNHLNTYNGSFPPQYA
jgi:hypothetical protein